MAAKALKIVCAPADSDIYVNIEASVYAKEGQILFVPEGVLLHDVVDGRDYRRLKRIMRVNSESFWSRLKFLFRGRYGKK